MTACLGHTDNGHCRLCRPDLYEGGLGPEYQPPPARCKHGQVGACGFCMSGTEPDLRARPTNGPPNPQAIAEDLRMRARRLDKISDQLRTEASDLFFAANRIEEMAR